MAELLEKHWIGYRIVNSVTPKQDRQSFADSEGRELQLSNPDNMYVATIVYGGVQVIPHDMMMNATNGGEKSPTGAVYDLIKVLKELTVATFELAKADGLLVGISLEDIK